MALSSSLKALEGIRGLIGGSSSLLATLSLFNAIFSDGFLLFYLDMEIGICEAYQTSLSPL